jgi:hypothetical protein
MTAARRVTKSFRRFLLHLRRNAHPCKCTQMDDHEEVCSSQFFNFFHSSFPRRLTNVFSNSPKVEFCGYRSVLECSHCSPLNGHNSLNPGHASTLPSSLSRSRRDTPAFTLAHRAARCTQPSSSTALLQRGRSLHK